GGSGATGGSGASGAVKCGSSSCSLPGNKCCHADDGVSAAGTCTAQTTLCAVGFVDMFCDEPADCGAGKVCCERISQVGNLNSIKCEATVADCKPLGSGTASLACNPAAPSCPMNQSCVATSRGYSHCQ
ncbi:MAG: hypothetical protein HYZ29_18215, partial [Myxococcales bacterium]|nr:hypothetical protein [Myxococcales bacterium]